MGEANTIPQLNKEDFKNTLMQPSTPDKHRRLSISIPKDEQSTIPTTPPQSSARRSSQSSFKSPDAYTHCSHTILSPTTPSDHGRSNSGNKLGTVPLTPMNKLLSHENGESPLKSPSQLADDDLESKPPIRQITTKLRTRLNYAMVKYSNGWMNQSLSELEKTVLDKDVDVAMDGSTASGLVSSPFGKAIGSPSRVAKPQSQVLSPRKTKRDHRRSMEPLDAGGSANAAFLHAISKSLSPKRRPHLNTNSLRIDNTISMAEQPHDSPEAEAIETLMSLSSPRSVKKMDLPTRSLPRQRLSFGDGNAIETESESEYDERSQVRLDSKPKDKDDEALTDSAPGSP
jgi:hypothetical protein